MVLLPQRYLFVFFCHRSDSAVSTQETTGTATILSNHVPVVIDAAFGTFRWLSYWFTNCILPLRLACKNCFIYMENNFVLFYFSGKIN